MPELRIIRVRQPAGRKSWEGEVVCGDHRKSFGLGRCPNDYQARLKLSEKAEKWAARLTHPQGPNWQAHELKRPIAEHVDELIASKKNIKRASPETVRKYREHLELLIRECNLRTVEDIKLHTITSWFVSNGDKRKPRALKNIRDTWRMFSRYLYKLGIHDRVELDTLEAIEYRGTEDTASPFSVDELHRLLSIAPQTRSDIYAALALLGLRCAEAKRILVSDVHLDSEPPHVEVRAKHAKNKDSGLLAVSAPGLVDVLRRMIDGRQPADRLFRSFPADKTLYNDLAAARIPRKRPDGSPVAWHSFRKTAAQLVVDSGMHMRNAQDQLRHKSADMTARVYTRSHLASRHNEFANLPDIFEKCPTKVSHDTAEAGGKTRTSAVRQTPTGNGHKSLNGEVFEQSRKPKNFRELSEQKRRGGDSNPRGPGGPTGFRIQRIQPLCHLSDGWGTMIAPLSRSSFPLPVRPAGCG